MLIAEKEYSTHEIVACQSLYDQVVTQHIECGGTGLEVIGAKVSDCICVSTYNYLVELTYARLPKGFWNVSIKQLKNLLHKERQEFCAELQSEFKLFSGLVIGNALSGKTSFLTLVGKLALLNGRKVMYITPEDIIQSSKQDSDKILLNRLVGMELVLVDGIEDFNLQYENQVLLVKNTLSKLTDRGVHVIVTTGITDPEQFRGKLSESLANFLSKLPDVFITDLRKTNYENLSVENYLDSELSKEAKKYFNVSY